MHPNLSYQFEFEENRHQIIIIENPINFTKFCQELVEQCSGKEGKFVLSEEENILPMDKFVYMIIDPFSLDFNQRRILNKLYTELKELAMSQTLYLETNTMLVGMEKYIMQLIAHSEYPIAYEEIDFTGIFKMANLKMETTYENMVEKIVDYMKIMRDICNLSICVLVNIKTYLSEKEINQVYEFAEYNKIHLLLIESNEKKRNGKEKVCIWDKDSCEIY
ncbi:MAG: type II-A CRISPR-associated protein Csn2 [Lachnospiraceae bacterium]